MWKGLRLSGSNLDVDVVIILLTRECYHYTTNVNIPQ